MVYLFALLLILFGVYFYDYRNNREGRLISWIFLCLVLICIAGFRYRLGQDTLTYIRDYSSLHPVSQLKISDFEKTRFAPGFVIITSVFKQFTPEFIWFQFFHSVIVNTVLFYFFYKYCWHIFFAALVYFFYLYFLLTFQQMREALAVCVFLLAWPAFREGRWLLWYLASILAFLFHMSAIMMFFLPVICLPGIKQLFIFGRRTWIVCIAVLISGILVQAILFKYLEVLAFIPSMMERIKNYEHNALGGSILNFNGIIGTFFQYIIYPVIALYFIQKRKKFIVRRQKYEKFDAFVLMSIYVAIFSLSVTIMARFNNYFFPFAIIAMSEWLFGYFRINKKKVKIRLIYWVIIFLPMFLFHISGTYFNDMNRSGTLKTYMVYYPYASVFDKNLDPKTERAIQYIRRRI